MSFWEDVVFFVYLKQFKLYKYSNPSKITAQLLAPGEIKMKVTFRLKFVDIWTGSYNTFAKDSEGNIHVFGLNNYKQMGKLFK